MPSFAEIMRMVGRTTPEIEATLAKKAAASEEAQLTKQIRDHEYSQAQASHQPNSLPGGQDFELVGTPQTKDFDLVGEPRTGGLPSVVEAPIPEGGVRVSPDMGMNPVPRSMNAAGIPIGGPSPEELNKFNPLKAYGIGAGALGAGALAYDQFGDATPRTGIPAFPDKKGPSPASVPNKEEDPEQTKEAKKDKSDYSRIMGMLSPRKEEPFDMSTMVQGTSLGGDEAMKEAMARRDTNQFLNKFQRGAAQITAGFAGADYDKVGGKEIEEDAKNLDQPIKDLKDRIENQENDPKSTASVSMRAIAAKMGFPFPDSISAADIKKQVPQMTSLINHRDTLEANRQNLALRQLERLDSKKDKLDAKNKDWIFAASTKASKLVDDYTKVKRAEEVANGYDGKNPAAQITALYDFVKVLDQNSAVREGEISLVGTIVPLMGKMEIMMNKVRSGKPLDEATVRNINQEIKRIAAVNEKFYNTRMDIYRKQNQKRGGQDSDMEQIDPYYNEHKNKTRNKDKESDSTQLAPTETRRTDKKTGQTAIWDTSSTPPKFIRWEK